MRKKFIAVDFDGTCVTHAYPIVGKEIGAVRVLKKLAERHNLIIYTMRSGDKLEDAKEWFNKHGIKFMYANENRTQKHWTDSPKIYAHIYIDDAALGVPLINNPEMSERPYVDWDTVEQLLISKGYLD